jgi:hypothetical protein
MTEICGDLTTVAISELLRAQSLHGINFGGARGKQPQGEERNRE